MSIAARLDRLFSATSVAVIGASTRNNLATGNHVVRNLRSGGFTGEIFLVHPSGDTIEGIEALVGIDALPAIDAAVIAVGAAQVISVVLELEAAGCPVAVILSVGLDSAQLDQLREVHERGRMLVHGPNCMGVIGVSESLRLWAEDDNLAGLEKGDIALLSQSGSGAIFVARSVQGRGFSRIISTGNEVGLTTADYIRWLATDPGTAVIGIVVESISDVDGFRSAVHAARQVGKPIVVLKVGRSDTGATATVAHTGAILSSEAAYQSLFDELDLPLVADYDELASALELLSTLAGRSVGQGRVGVLTISGGQAALAADIAASVGVVLPALAAPTVAALEGLFPGGVVHNPLDAASTTDASEEHFRQAIELIADDPQIDVVVAVLDAQITLSASELGYEDEYFASVLAAKPSTPVIVASSSSHTLHRSRVLGPGARVGVARGLHNAFVAIRTAGRNRSPVTIERVRPDGLPDAATVSALIERIARVSGPVGGELLHDIQTAYGIRLAPSAVVSDSSSAATFAAEVGYPVVVKVNSADIAHRSDVGGVVVGVVDQAGLDAACAAITKSVGEKAPGARIDGFEVQRQLVDHIEAFVGFVNDGVLGSNIGVGLGGTLVELLNDTRHGRAPLTSNSAAALISDTILGRLLDGYRSLHPQTDMAPLANLVQRISWLAIDLAPVIAEADFNPVLIEETTGRAWIVDSLLIAKGSGDPAKESGAEATVAAPRRDHAGV